MTENNIIEDMLNIMTSGHRIFVEDFYNDKKDLIKKQFKKDLVDYLSNHKEQEQELLILYKTVNATLDGNNEHVFYVYDQLLSYKAPNYVIVFQEVLKCYKDNEKRALDLLKTINYDKVIELFKKKYVNASLFVSTLSMLNSKVPEDKEKQTTYLNEKILRSNDNKAIINELYQSGLSPLDFYFYNRVDIGKYNQALSFHKKSDIVVEIMQRENHTLPLLEKIIKHLAYEDFDIISYYKLTKINIRNLKKIAKKYNIEISKEASIKISQSINNTEIKPENEMNATLILNGIEVPNKIKENAISYIQDNNIPLNAKTYDTMIRKLMR